MKKSSFLLLCIALLYMSCKKEATSTTEPNTTTEKPKPSAEVVKPGMLPRGVPNIMLVPARENSYEFEDAKLESYSYKNGKFKYVIKGISYELGSQTPDAKQKLCANSAEGQHIHLIVDSLPYVAKYTAEFDHSIADGDHYLMSFLSRSYHESIKTKNAFKAQKVTVKNGSIVKSADVKEPMLFYSRPKGTYVGNDTRQVLLDFYLANCTLSPDGYGVLVKIGKATYTIRDWRPHFLEGLPMGETEIQLTLIDKNNETVKAPFNPIKHKIVLMENAPTEAGK